MTFVVFDLDGTLALNAHRQHFLQRAPKDWDAWHAACPQDVVNPAVMCALDAHELAGHRVEIWSGRSDRVRAETIAWMELHCIDPSLLTRMRPAGDHRPDVILKRGWLSESRVTGRGPDLVYDDRDAAVAMWREAGVPCFQVAPGEF